MATIKQIQFKRSNVAGKRPLPADIAEGELAINIKDATLFTKNAEGLIIDLGFAKGGRIDGNVVHVGDYTQTGNYVTNGNITGNTILAKTALQSDGDIITKNGTIRARTIATENSNFWFEGLEVDASKNYERAVLYAPVQTAAEGRVNLRVQNGSAVGSGSSVYTFSGNGDFSAGRDVYSSRGRSSIEVITPTLTASRLYTRNRTWNQFGTDQSYGWDDTVNYVAGENGALALNYVYKGRASSVGTIWHQLIDDRVASEWALYTGSTASNKVFSVISQGGLGQGKFTGALMVGGDAASVSALGNNSIALGETNTGISRTSVGNLDAISGGSQMFRFSTSEGINRSYKRLQIQHSDAVGTATLPPSNTAQLQIDTSGDSNNAGGNGLTMLGYYAANGEYYHYFRGHGEAAFNMTRGVNIAQGGLKVTGTASLLNDLTVAGTTQTNRINSSGDIILKNAGQRNIRFENGVNNEADGQIFKDGPSAVNRRPGMWFIAHAPGNPAQRGQMILNEDGNLIVNTGQILPRDYDNFTERYYGKFNLGSGINLDTIIGNENAGVWNQAVSANATLALNYPEAQAGTLSLTTGAGAQQLYHVYNSTRMYVRARDTSGPWTSWDRIATQSYLSSGEMDSEVVVNTENGLRLIGGSRGVILRNDGTNAYILLTNQNDQLGPFNAIRPFTVNCATGAISIGTEININSGGIGISQVNGAGINMNSVAGGAVYLLGRKAGVNGFYIGMPVGHNNDASFYSYINQTGITLTNNAVVCSRRVLAAEFVVSSDAVLKTDVRNIENQRKNLHNVTVKRYKMKDGRNDDAVGVIAQDIEKIYPEFVGTDNDGIRHVNYRGLSTVLWKIVQEQDVEIEDVKSRLTRIEKLLSK